MGTVSQCWWVHFGKSGKCIMIKFPSRLSHHPDSHCKYSRQCLPTSYFFSRATKLLSLPFETMPPLRFVVANIGQQTHGHPTIIIRLDGSWDKVRKMGTTTWVASLTSLNNGIQQGSFMYAVPPSLIEAMACLQALQWAWNEGVSSLKFYTNSTVLVQCLNLDKIWGIMVKLTIAHIRKIAKAFRCVNLSRCTRNR